jgi:hypothetical protein
MMLLFLLMMLVLCAYILRFEILMSLGTPTEWLGAYMYGNWYLERLNITKFTRSASITE